MKNPSMKDVLATQSQVKAELIQVKVENLQLKQLVTKLEEANANLKQKLFGSSSEKAPRVKGAPRTRKPSGIVRDNHGRSPIEAELPRVDEVVDVEEVMRPGMDLFATEVRELLTWRCGYWYVRRLLLRKYAIKGEPDVGVVGATMPSIGVERGKFDSSVAARLIHGKYTLHLPVHRQLEDFASEGVVIANQTAIGHMMRCAVVLRPLGLLLQSLINRRTAKHSDDTPVDQLDPGGGTGKSLTARIWCNYSDCDGPPLVSFIASDGRTKEDAATAIGSFGGYIHADACPSHDQLFLPRQDGGPVAKEVACMAHVRRKFYEARESLGKKQTEKILKIIARLYAIEADIRSKYKAAAALATTPAMWQEAANLRHDYRLRKGAAALIDDLLSLVDAVLKDQPPGSAVHRAAVYAGNLRLQLRVYLDDGRLEIDNNNAENTLRRVAIGRKNWLFFGSEIGAAAGALFMTLAANCKLHDVDFFDYIQDVLPRIAAAGTELEQHLPHKWQPLPVSAG
jgi:transposase